MPAYQNLAPEDCEQILELTAVNHADTGMYSPLVGWGKLNAGKALRLVEKPWNTIHHFGNTQLQSNFNFELESNNVNVYLKEPLQNDLEQWFSKGNYQMNIYRYDASIHHEINEGDTIIAYWPRPSSSNLLEEVKNDSLLPRERISIDYLDRDSCETHGYIYELLDGGGNTLGWLPDDTIAFKPKFEYTILSRDSLAPIANINGLKKQEVLIDVYPNPSTDFHTLRMKGALNTNFQVSMYDLQGRRMLKTFSGSFANEKIELINNISSLASGLYVYHITIGSEISSIKFIKQ